DRRWFACQSIAKSAQFLVMAFVRLAALPKVFSVSPEANASKIVHDVGFAVAKDFDPLFGKSIIRTECGISKRADAAIRVGHRRNEVVVSIVWEIARLDRLRSDSIDPCCSEKSEYVVHMTGLAKIPSTALCCVHPMVEWDISRVDAIVHH